MFFPIEFVAGLHWLVLDRLIGNPKWKGREATVPLDHCISGLDSEADG